MKISHSYESTLKLNKISAITASVLAFQHSSTTSNTTYKLTKNNKSNKWKISFIENSVLNNKWTQFKW